MDLLQSLPLGTVVSGEPTILELLRQHPRYNEKTDNGRLRIRKDWKLVVIDDQDRPICDFGWSKAVRGMDGKPSGLTHRECVQKAARNAIHPQIAEFRREHNLGPDVEVDHEEDLATLLDRWAGWQLISLDEIRVRRNKKGYRVMADDRMRVSWEIYHRQHARLRPIGREEHIEKRGQIATYCSGFKMGSGVLTKHKAVLICKEISSLLGVGVRLEGIGHGFLQFECQGYKSMRLHCRTGGEWPWITGDEERSWQGDETVIYSDLKGAGTTLKSFDGAPVWTVAELAVIVDVLEANGITVVKRSIPKQADLVFTDSH